MKCHGMTLQFDVFCGRRAKRTTIVNGKRDDPLAKLITCKTCRRVWRKLSR
jgi:hypothetical protein